MAGGWAAAGARAGMVAPMTQRVLIVDDGIKARQLLSPALKADGYRVRRAATIADGLDLAARFDPSAIIFDLDLPGPDWRQSLGELRKLTASPLIVISARRSQKVAALDDGADDFVDKPYVVSEVLACLRACLRRTLRSEGAAPIWRRDGIEIDLLHHRLRVEGRTVGLTPFEYGLLSVLARNAGQVMRREDLLSAIWGQSHEGDTQYLRVCVGHIRSKLGRHGKDLLRTAVGVGYWLVDPD